MFRRYDVAVTAATRREPARCHRRASKEPHGRAQDPQLPLDPRRPQARPSRRQVRHDRAPAPRHQAVRAGHQRADARPDQPVPLRGARHLPADLHAGGARQQQEGHDRGRAQRAPGQPLPRRTGERRADDEHRRGHPARRQVATAPRRAGCSCRPRRSPTTLPPSLASGKADNQILGVVMHLQRSASRSARSILVSKDINMRIKARALGMAAEDYFNDKVLEDTELLYTGIARAAGRLLGQARQGHGVLAAGRPHLLPRHRARWCPSLLVNEFVYHESRARRRSTRWSREITARRSAVLDAQGLLAPEEQRLGHHRAQPRAELRAQPADEPGDRLRHAARARPAPARRCSRSPPGSCRRWSSRSTRRSS